MADKNKDGKTQEEKDKKDAPKEPTAGGEEITNPKVRAQVGLPVKDERTRDQAAQPETAEIGPAPHTNQSHPEEDDEKK